MLAPDVVRCGGRRFSQDNAEAGEERFSREGTEMEMVVPNQRYLTPANGKEDVELIIAIASCSEIEAPGYEGIL